MLRKILSIMLFITLFLFIVVQFFDLLIFLEKMSWKITTESINVFSNISLILFVLTYLILINMSFIQLRKEKILESKRDFQFWKKIILFKPISGMVAFSFAIDGSHKYKLKKYIRLFYYSRNILFVILIGSIFLLFINNDPSDIYLLSIIVSMLLSIIVHLFVEAMILIDAWQIDKDLWNQKDFYSYFTSVKSILGYNEYFRKYVGFSSRFE